MALSHSVKQSSLIGHTLEVLALALAGRRPADTVVGEFFRARHYLGSSDRRRIAESCYGVIRHHRLLAARALRALGRPEGSPVDALLLVAVHEAVSSNDDADVIASALGDRWQVAGMGSADFVRAVRSCAAGEPAWPLAVRHSLPDFVAAEWARRFPPDEAEALCAASNAQPPLAIRVNTLKGSVASCTAALEKEGIAAAAGNFSPVALVLPRRINTASLRAFRDGLFEMQDEGSQAIAPLLDVRPGMAVLDACAGGGGKSLHLAALMENRGEITALDVDRTRLDRLRLRARRAGVSIVRSEVVRRGSPALRAGGYDAVLVDAPCSGTGTFRRNPWAKLACTEDASRSYALRQRELLRRYGVAVRPGGKLVYSTCTLLEAENRAVVEDFIALRPEFTLCDAGGILTPLGVHAAAGGPWLELLPHRTGTDGYFAAVMVRS